MVNGFFESLSEFSYVHHLALNTPSLYRDACNEADRYKDEIHVLEGDIC